MSVTSDFDGPWKEALEVFLHSFFVRCFPAIAEAIDWDHQPQWRDTELQQVAPTEDTGGQAVDKLVEVRLRGGDPVWVLVHIEVQNQRDRHFEARMFRYLARLYDFHRREIVSLAVLGDTSKRWRPHGFGYQRLGCSVQMTFPTVKLLDFTEEELLTDRNPFALIILAHRTAQRTRGKMAARAAAKIALTRRLFASGYSRTEIVQLYRLIDWLLRLPPGLDRQTWQQIRLIEEEQGMPFITTAERVGREDGLAEGLLQGIAFGLEVRLGEPGLALLPEIREIGDPQRLQAILERLKTAQTPDEVRAVYQPPPRRKGRAARNTAPEAQ